MANIVEEAFMTPFKFLELKDKKILININFADQLCGYINKFLPNKFTTNHGQKMQNDDSENEEEPEEYAPLVYSAGKMSRAKTIEELHKRIETLRGKKATYKEKLLKKGLKNRLKKKQKLEEKKKFKKELKKFKNLESTNVKSGTDDAKEVVQVQEDPIENEIKFNKLLLSQSLNTTNQKTDPRSLLAKLTKKKLRLKKLESKGKNEKLTEIKSKEAWDSALQKAEGIKVRDDIDLIKRSIGKIKNRKNKSKKKWEERDKIVQSKKEKAQKKRQDNISKKRKERSKKRVKVLIKKGRILPE